MTVGVTAFSLVPLATIMGEAKTNSMIDAQAAKIANGPYSPAQKEKWNAVITGLRSPNTTGHVEMVAFPGFFTSASTSIPDLGISSTTD